MDQWWRHILDPIFTVTHLLHHWRLLEAGVGVWFGQDDRWWEFLLDFLGSLSLRKPRYRRLRLRFHLVPALPFDLHPLDLEDGFGLS